MLDFNLFYKIFTTVIPLVIIVGVGFFYAQKVSTNMDVANKINIDIFIPALIFSVLSAKSFSLTAFFHLALGAFIVVLGSGLILLPFCRFLQITPKTFLPPMMFNNSGNLGLPLIVLAFGEQALPAATILFIVGNGLHFTVGLFILNPHVNPLTILKTPTIAATLLGLVISILALEVPIFLATPIELLGQISIPLMLFALGVRMTQVNFSDWKIGLWGAVLSPLSGLMMAWSAQLLLSLPTEQYRYLLVFGTLPPAVLNYMVAERYQQQPQQVASIVLIGNIAALLIIPVALIFILS